MPIRVKYPHLLLKCLYQARKISSHEYVGTIFPLYFGAVVRVVYFLFIFFFHLLSRR
jgi:hypothetical protein